MAFETFGDFSLLNKKLPTAGIDLSKPTKPDASFLEGDTFKAALAAIMLGIAAIPKDKQAIAAAPAPSVSGRGRLFEVPDIFRERKAVEKTGQDFRSLLAKALGA